jgi:hypothetical protein
MLTGFPPAPAPTPVPRLCSAILVVVLGGHHQVRERA